MADRLCPMCGDVMPPKDTDNALSRYYPVYICSKCGDKEALRDYYNVHPLPPDQWFANPVMLMSLNDGVLFDDHMDSEGFIIPKYDKRYINHSEDKKGKPNKRKIDWKWLFRPKRKV